MKFKIGDIVTLIGTAKNLYGDMIFTIMDFGPIAMNGDTSMCLKLHGDTANTGYWRFTEKDLVSTKKRIVRHCIP